MKLDEIIRAFGYEGKNVGCESFGEGHINDTYAVSFEEEDGLVVRYVLQRMNDNIFKNVEGLMENVGLVSDYLKDAIIAEGKDPSRECLQFKKNQDGKYYFQDSEGSFWRTYRLIEDCCAYQLVEDKDMFEDAGRAFGRFINRLDGFDANLLCEVIEDFHNTANRMELFGVSLDKDFENRSFTAKKEIEFFLARKEYCSKVVAKLASGVIPLRVTHNDTKLNNVLIDNETQKAICVIDLDTIMPGSMLYDFGDAIRSGCNTGLEDEKDLSKVAFDIELFESFSKGFLEGVGKNITPAEKSLLAFGAILMTFECGMRFLTDYLNGDVYFKTKYAEHNLVRARTQIKLVEDMEKQLDKMNEIVSKYCKI